MTKRAKSRGFSATVVSLHCWRSSETFAGSPATTRARDGSLLQDAALQDLRRPVGVAAGEQRDHLGAGGQSAGHPEHPHRDDGAVLVGFELLDEPRQRAGRRVVVRAARSTVDVGVGMLAPLAFQPVVEQLSFGGRRHRGQHQRVVGGGEAGAIWSAADFHGRPFVGGRLLRCGLLGRRLLRGRLLGRCLLGGAFLARRSLAAAFLAGAFFAGALLPRVQPGRRHLVVRPVLQRVQIQLTHLGDAVRTGCQRSSRRPGSAGTPRRRRCPG